MILFMLCLIDLMFTTSFLCEVAGYQKIYILLLFMFIFLVLPIPIIILYGCLFKKTGKSWGYSLIPIFNDIVLCRVIGLSFLWVVIPSVLITISSLLFSNYFMYIAIGIVIIYLVFLIIFSISLAKSFGKNIKFALGILFLSPVFLPILAFGKSKYVGPISMKDLIFRKLNKNNNTNNTYNDMNNQIQTQVVNNDYYNQLKPQISNVKYCINCGAQVDEYTRFCSNCGTEIK